MSATPLLPGVATVHTISRRTTTYFNSRIALRQVLSASVIATFLLFVFTASILEETGYGLPWKHPGWDHLYQPVLESTDRVSQDVVFPDFSHIDYVFRTLPPSHFPIYPGDHKRIIAVGDIHSMNQSLSDLLAKISFDPQSDTLVHLGDLVPKSAKVSGDSLLNFMSTSNILGVRGNNDQTVIEWKGWMDWIISLPNGKKWLKDVDSNWPHIDGDEPNPEFDAWLKKTHRKWEAYVPSGWKLLGNHYKAARDMSRSDFDYLRSLPLVLHAPTAHTYFVHAGLLAADPTRELDDPKQPLSHWPATSDPEEDELVLRNLQEVALLNEIPQNQDPWVLMNMRSLSKNGKVEKKGNKGTPWSEVWNDIMGNCAGFSVDPSKRSSKAHVPLHCFPSMVIYGHAAARGLDAKRWSVGLDTGCVYGRRLSAIVLDTQSLVLQTPSETVGRSLQDSRIPYGDGGMAQIISAKCHT